MTYNQRRCIYKAVECLQDARKWMDQAMYYSDAMMPDEEYKKVREAYDLACKAIDSL